MALQFFIDHCVPESIACEIEKNHDIVRLREQLPTNAPDERVIKEAQELNRVLVSLNGDFANIIQYPPSEYQGIIALQVRNRPEVIPEILERLSGFFQDNAELSYYEGKLILVEAHRIRIVT